MSSKQASAGVGRVFALNVHEHRDADTGAAVHRFIHRDGGEEQLFYYCSPALSPDGRFMPCWSNVSDSWQVHAIDRSREVSVQLSAIESDTPGNANFDADSPSFSVSHRKIFYHDQRRACWSDIETGKGTWFYEAPPGFHITHLSAQGRYVAFSVTEILNPGRTPRDERIGPYPQLHIRPRSSIFAYDLDTEKVEMCWGGYSYMVHTEMCPFDDNLVMYTDQSWERRQQEIYVVQRAFCEDKRAKPVIATGFEDYRGRTLDYIGHGFFTQDGFVGAQYVEYGGVDERNQYTDTASFNIVVTPDGWKKRKAKFPGSGKPCHVHCQKSEGLWVGDHWIKPDGAVDMDWLTVMRNHFDTQEMTIVPLARMGGHQWCRPFHPHPWLTPDEKQVVAAFNTGNGDNHVALIDVPADIDI